MKRMFKITAYRIINHIVVKFKNTQDWIVFQQLCNSLRTLHQKAVYNLGKSINHHLKDILLYLDNHEWTHVGTSFDAKSKPTSSRKSTLLSWSLSTPALSTNISHKHCKYGLGQVNGARLKYWEGYNYNDPKC